MDNTFNKSQYEQNVDLYLQNNPEGKIGGGAPQQRVILLKQFLPQGSTVFEIGSGPGYDALELQKAGYKIIASDFAEGFVKILQSKGFNTILFDAKQDQPPQGINAIYANAVFVHFLPTEFSDFIRRAKKSLEKDKILFLSVIKGEGSHREARKKGFLRDFNYYTPELLKKLLADAGYEILHLNIIDEKWIQVVARFSQ